MKRILVLLIITCGVALATSVEFPICSAPGDQLYPDVCWDGEAFWVVWQDDSLGTIRGVRVSEEGELLTGEVELLAKGSATKSMRYPCVAAGPDRIAVEARRMSGYDEFGNESWGVVHREFTFSGNPLYNPVWIGGSFECFDVSAPIVMFGKEHFFSLFKASHETPEDFHAWSMCIGLDSAGATQQDIWLSSTEHGEFEPSIGCWEGERFLVITSLRDAGVFLEDSMVIQGIGWNFELDRLLYQSPNDQGCIKYQTLFSREAHFFWASEIWTWGYGAIQYKIGFDILDSTGMPIKDSATIIDLGGAIKLYYPDAAFGKEDFVCCWENRFADNTVHLYAIEVDTLGDILDSGYITYDASVEQQPAIAFGKDKYLLVWADNRDGDFNIRGLVFDTLELTDGINEEKPVNNNISRLEVYPNPFKDKVMLSFTQKGGEREEQTLCIFDASGRRVNTLRMNVGADAITWDGRDAAGEVLPSGIYFVSLRSADRISNLTKRIVKIK